jgi:hypothetical protein
MPYTIVTLFFSEGFSEGYDKKYHLCNKKSYRRGLNRVEPCYSRKLKCCIKIINYIGIYCMSAIGDFWKYDELEKGLVSKALMQVKFANQTFGKKMNG